MGVLRTLRGWSGVLLAGFLALAILIPTLDTYICIADVQQASVTSVTKQMAQTGLQKNVPDQSQKTHDDADSSCPHGHCHHWVGVAKLGERLALNITLTNGELPGGLYSSPPSAAQIQLLRPPRA